ncbi:Hypoxanthine phosphoribosyltransferase [Gracilariopsis chorda]|uniref:Hypoxanthine phosphoribosyltransferase n=1 Tax=Gracilariopsis chorda TaxID=448386 RepID=A0A2V3IZ07_9FLOR|nr:Hypoxanthine phosphoribosyltransferase [Gracilariopsis chorda]|eukprot:PXF47374.1 Hypoxanthine phosphoribosyltransferase [Gracilariopsis chorda]
METGGEVPAEWENSVSEVLIGSADISRRVTELGHAISAKYEGLNPLLIVVLKGSYMFASDLSRAMKTPHELEFIRAKSYNGTESCGRVRIDGLENTKLKGRHLIIIEDIVDTGLTLSRLYEHFADAGAASIKTCSFLEKETVRRKSNVPNVDFVAFHIPDKFVIGYGLDYDQQYRHLPFVGVYKQ